MLDPKRVRSECQVTRENLWLALIIDELCKCLTGHALYIPSIMPVSAGVCDTEHACRSQREPCRSQVIPK